MSDLFNIYEDNYNTIINRVTKTIETFSNLSRGININNYYYR